MDPNSSTDDLAMTLMEQALRVPEAERERFLRAACGEDTTLFQDAWSYVKWEEKMSGFLRQPLRAPPEQPPFEPGQLLIGRFLVIREVARGGMGIVWEATDRKLDRRVALKCGRRGHGKQLPPEVRNAREISHPNVCKIYEIHTAESEHGPIDFISMEFLEGETLAELLRRGPIPSRDARAIAQQLCAGVAEAHRSHLVHGDLKTHNVILTKDFSGTIRAVITDFGLAQQTDTSSGALGGTRDYMAPELWKGSKASIQSDLFALGVMLWELRSRKPPEALGIANAAKAPGAGIGWKPPTGRSRWDRAIARCLDPVPARRFDSASDVARAIGPSRALRVVAVASIAVFLAAASGLLTYRQTTAPKHQVMLAILPSAVEGSSAEPTRNLLKQTSLELSALRGNKDTSFRILPTNAAHTTHTLRAEVERNGTGVVVHAVLRDLRAQVDKQDWRQTYTEQELQYAGKAIAGMVTESLHVPPPQETMRAEAKASYDAGLAAMEHDQITGAIPHFQHASELDKGSSLVLARLAESEFYNYALTSGKVTWLNRATDTVRRAQLRNPDVAPLHQISGLLKKQAGQDAEAIAEMLRAIEIDPKDGDVYRRLGGVYDHNKQYQEALAAYLQAIEKAPKQFRNYKELGEYYGRRTQYPQQIAQLKKALTLSPDNENLEYRLSKALTDNGDFEEAEQNLRASMKSGETSLKLHELGMLLLWERKEAEAVRVFDRALQQQQDRPNWWMNLGNAYRLSGRAAEARSAYQQGLIHAERELSSHPENATVRSWLGFICAQLGDRERAEFETRQALSFAHDDDMVGFIAACTFETLRKRPETLALLEKSASGLVASLNRWPDVADLHQDSRFIQLFRGKRKNQWRSSGR